MNQMGTCMKSRRFVIALGVGLPMLALPLVGACNIDSGTGSPDPGLYWGWVCDGGGTPLDASASLNYVASGSCGNGGPFTLSVDGCEMFGSWSALGLSNVHTTQTSMSPGLGGWSITASGAADGGTLWSCAAKPAVSGDLLFTCYEAVTSAVTCQSMLTTADGS